MDLLRLSFFINKSISICIIIIFILASLKHLPLYPPKNLFGKDIVFQFPKILSEFPPQLTRLEIYFFTCLPGKFF